MRKYLFLICLFFTGLHYSFAQMSEKQKELRFERIHAARLAYIVDRLQLTERQSAEFTPIYNYMMGEIRVVRKEFNDKHKDDMNAPADDSVSRQYIDDDLDYQERVIAIRRKYKERFLKYITATQLAKLPEAERDFNRMIFNMRKHNGPREHGGWFRSSSSRGY
jgi:DNA-binding SARP family transcriptional activator